MKTLIQKIFKVFLPLTRNSPQDSLRARFVFKIYLRPNFTLQPRSFSTRYVLSRIPIATDFLISFCISDNADFRRTKEEFKIEEDIEKGGVSMTANGIANENSRVRRSGLFLDRQ